MTWPVVAAVLALAQVATADDQHSGPTLTRTPAEVLVIWASEGDGPFDPSLNGIRALKQPPFNGFKSMKIFSREQLSLEPDQPLQIDLPKRRKLRITLGERRSDGRFKVAVSINRPNKQDYLPLLEVVASPGEPFFVAGQKYYGGTLVIGVRVGERHSPRK
ncbi:MAG TPA: hypothetical protein VJR89_20205 [Polyangiales bacterium]|nr:hypothetical protein [Polyangiales bacterium]